VIAKYRKILSQQDDDSAFDTSTKAATSYPNPPARKRLIILSASKIEALRGDLAETIEELSSLRERYNAQAQLIAMLGQTNSGHHLERAVIEDTNEKLREAAEEYKLQLQKAHQRTAQLKHYIQDMNHHLSHMKSAKKELTEHNEMIQDQLALAYLTPFLDQADEVKKEEDMSLNKLGELPVLKPDPEENIGYAFTARTYYPTPIYHESNQSSALIPSPSMAEMEWEDDADLRDIMDNMPTIDQIDPSPMSPAVISAYGAIHMSVGLPVLPDLVEKVQFVPDSGAINDMVSHANYRTHGITSVTGNPPVQGIGENSLRVIATGSMLILDNEGREPMMSDVMLVPDKYVNAI
jgi:hypothetical protein